MPRSPRDLALRVLGDERVRADPNWKDKARAAIARANSFFQPLAIRFEAVDLGRWDTHTASAPLGQVLEELEQQPKGSASLVVGLIGGESFTSAVIDAVAQTRLLVGDAVVVRWCPPETLGVMLAHELVHVFGGVHVEVGDSIMRPQLDVAARRIDAQNIAIVDAARNRQFSRNEAPLTIEDARRVLLAVERVLRNDRHNRDAEDARTELIEYLRTLEAENQGVRGPRGEAARLVAAGVAERSRGRSGHALAYFREAVRVCSRCERVHLEMARELLDRGHLDDALAELEVELAINARSAEAHYLLGALHRRAGREGQARQAFEEALRIDPQHVEAREALEGNVR